MRTNHVKQKLKQGELALGAWLNFPGIATARVMAQLGFDWLVVDMEHSAQSATLMADMVATIADGGTCAPLVRVFAHVPLCQSPFGSRAPCEDRDVAQLLSQSDKMLSPRSLPSHELLR